MELSELLKQKSGIKLDIACGENKQGPEWVGIDMRELPGVDIVHDLEEYPWPLPDECVVVAVCSHFVEHVNPARFGFVNFMNELWRVMKPGARVAITTPHGYSPGYLQDPTHCNQVSEATWAYFDPGHPSGLYNIYKPRPWEITDLSWSPVTTVEVVLRKREVQDAS